MPYEYAKNIYNVLNHWEDYFNDTRPYLMMLNVPTCEQMVRRETFIAPKDAMKLAIRAEGQVRLTGYGEAQIVEGHTTVDGMGMDGDDTIHVTYSYHTPPAVVKAEVGISEEDEPETIDFVFIDFMESHIADVFRRLGSEYTKHDMKPYGSEKFDAMMNKWIKRNWPQEC
jgi:hypothetical protein